MCLAILALATILVKWQIETNFFVCCLIKDMANFVVN